MNTSKNVSIMCFHDELCQVFNAMMTALNLLRQGAKVTVFFGSRGVNAIHRAKMPKLRCLPDMPEMGAGGHEPGLLKCSRKQAKFKIMSALMPTSPRGNVLILALSQALMLSAVVLSMTFAAKPGYWRTEHPYAKGETAGMQFRVGDPDPGETLGSVAGRMTFVILSGIRQNTR